MITINTESRRYAAAVAALLSAASGTLGFAGARAQSEHIGVAFLVLAVAGALGIGAVFSWGLAFRSSSPHSAAFIPAAHIEPVELPDDLATAAQRIADAVTSWDADALDRINDLHAEGYSDSTFLAARAAADALHDSRRGVPEIRATWKRLTTLSAACAETYLAVLTSDLITYAQWDQLTRPWRQADLHPLLPLPVATRYNTTV